MKSLDEKTATICKQNMKILMLNYKNTTFGHKPQIVKKNKGELEDPSKEVVEEQDASKIKILKKKNTKGKKR